MYMIAGSFCFLNLVILYFFDDSQMQSKDTLAINPSYNQNSFIYKADNINTHDFSTEVAEFWK